MQGVSQKNLTNNSKMLIQISLLIGVMEAGIFLIDFFGYFLPTMLAADADTTSVVFTLIVFVCHSIFSFRLLKRSGDNRYGCRF